MEHDRNFRDEQELAFRRGCMNKLKLLGVILLAACLLGILLEFYFRTGKIMATSRNLGATGLPTIKIREIRSSILDDNPQYRFEYYQYSYSGIWSCQSYVGRSYRANSAQIEWAPDGTATVSLDHNPVFTCKRGVWSDTRHQ